MNNQEMKPFAFQPKDHGQHLFFEIALSSGMRPEKYLSLCWNDISFEKARQLCNVRLFGAKAAALCFANQKGQITPHRSFTKIDLTQTLENTNDSNLNII